MMTSESIHLEHALLYVANLDRSLLFYRELLPHWTIRWEGRTEEGTRWAHYGEPGGGQSVYLSLYETPQAVARDAAMHEVLQIKHLGFSHPDVDAMVERLEARGIQPTDRVDDGKYRRIYYTDPDGHDLEFVQKLAGD